MSAIRIVLVLWSGLFLILGFLKAPGDGDLWWQRWLGERILSGHRLPHALGPETFTSIGAPWVPQEWLLSVAVAFAMGHALFWLLTLLAVATPIGILVSIVGRSRGRASPEAVAVVLLFVGTALVPSFGVRAQVLAWGCFALYLLLLERRDGWYYAAVPTVAVWANLHASALLAPAFLLMRIFGSLCDDGLRGLARSRDLRLLPLAAVAVLCTPLGWHLPAYAIALSSSPIRHYIAEWQPASILSPDAIFSILPLAILLAVGTFSRALRWADVLPAAMLLAAALIARRNEPLFAIAAALPAAVALSSRFANVRKLSERIAGIERFAIVTSVVGCAVTGAAFARAQAQAPPLLPAAAIAELADRKQPQRLLCEDFSACSLALQYPNLRVFLDGRCDPYPLAVWKAYLAVISVKPSWRDVLRRYGVDSVVATRTGRLARALSADAAWQPEYRDARFVLYVRSRSASPIPKRGSNRVQTPSTRASK